MGVIMTDLYQVSMFTETELFETPAPFVYKAIAHEHLGEGDNGRNIPLVRCMYMYPKGSGFAEGARCKGEFLVYHHHLMGRKGYKVYCGFCRRRWIYNDKVYKKFRRDPKTVHGDALAFVGYKILTEDSTRTLQIWIPREYDKPLGGGRASKYK